jgi:hypothetical protein
MLRNVTKFQIIGLITLLLACSFCLHAKDWTDDQLIIRFEEKVTDNEIKNFTQKFAKYEMKEIDIISENFNFRLMSFNEKLVKMLDLILEIEQESIVILAGPNLLLNHTPPSSNNTTILDSCRNIRTLDRTFTPYDLTDPLVPEQWALENWGQDIFGREGLPGFDIKALYAYEYLNQYPNDNSRQVAVAVIAKGFSHSHDDEINWFEPWNSGNFREDDLGTAISGVIGAFGNNGIGISGIGGDQWPIQVVRAQYDTYIEPSNGMEYVDLVSLIRAYEYVYHLRFDYDSTDGQRGAFVSSIVTTASHYTDDALFISFLNAIFIPFLDIGIFQISFARSELPPNTNFSYSNYFPVNLNTEWNIRVVGSTSSGDIDLTALNCPTFIDITAPSYYVMSTSLRRPGSLLGYTLYKGSETGAGYVAGTIALMHKAASESQLQYYRQHPQILRSDFRSFLLDGADYRYMFQKSLNAYVPLLLVRGGQLYNDFYTAIDDGEFMHIAPYIIIGSFARVVFYEVDNHDETLKRVVIKSEGSLEISNSNISFGNCYIQSFGFDNRSDHSNSTISFNSGRIEYQTGGLQGLWDVDIHLNNSLLIINGGTTITWFGGSLTTTGESMIIGCKSDGDPAPYIDDPWGWLNIGYHYDTMYMIDAGANFSQETQIISYLRDTRWNGIGFFNWSNPQNIAIRGNISGLQNFVISGVNVVLESSEISNIGQLRIVQGARVSMSDTEYHNNSAGIFVSESVLHTNEVDIYSNSRHGLNVLNGEANLWRTRIYENQLNGINQDRRGQVTLFNGTEVKNNFRSQIEAPFSSFPLFRAPNYYQFPLVADQNPFWGRNYLLMATGFHSGTLPPSRAIDATTLLIDYSNSSRFFPDARYFDFANLTISSARQIYNSGIDQIVNEDYIQANYTMRFLASTPLYQSTLEARMALNLLPYIDRAIGGYPDRLFIFMENLNGFYRRNIVISAQALLLHLNQEYEEAISLYQEIIDDPDDEYELYTAELDQAISFYMFYMQNMENGGNRASGCVSTVKSTRRPTSYAEFSEIMNEIQTKILQLSGYEIEACTPELTKLSASNFPNPFNPSTTISFSIPSDGIVKIDIFNVKGQKVKTLTDAIFTAGCHSLVWNGTDQENKSVGSGLYFYRVQKEHQSITNKMILMK